MFLYHQCDLDLFNHICVKLTIVFMKPTPVSRFQNN